MTVSGLRDMLSMPWATSQSAKSAWSDGPWPQIPTYLPCSRQAVMAILSSFLTAGLRSSNLSAIKPESRSSPSVS